MEGYKDQIKLFLKNFAIILAILFCFYFIYTTILPYVIELEKEFLYLAEVIKNNMKIVIMILIILLLFIFLLKRLINKLIYLLGQETSEKEMYYQSIDSWNKGEFDVVYKYMNYIYEVSQKNNFQNIYTKTAEAILLFQETDFTNEEITNKEISKLIQKFLSTYDYKELELNVIHLAYLYLHLAKLEVEIERKTICHLVCFYFFSKYDSKKYKDRIDVEKKLFNLFKDRSLEQPSQYIPEDIFQTLLHPEDVNYSKQFYSKVIPYLKKFNQDGIEE